MRGITAVMAAFLFAACAHTGGRSAGDAGQACEALQDAVAGSGMRGPVEMSGDALIDVNQYRVRGHFALFIDAPHELRLEYQSSGVMGGGREDVVFSYVADTLRVLDRERGEFYEGDDVNRLIEDGVGDRSDVAMLVRRLILALPPCAAFSELRTTGDGVEGRVDGGEFRIRTGSVRVTEARWPAPVATSLRDRLEISYRWDRSELVEIVLWMPTHRWRIRLQRSN